jgi:hypothetical protein
VVVSAWEGELDRDKMKTVLSGSSDSETILQEASTEVSKEDVAAA